VVELRFQLIDAQLRARQRIRRPLRGRLLTARVRLKKKNNYRGNGEGYRSTPTTEKTRFMSFTPLSFPRTRDDGHRPRALRTRIGRPAAAENGS